MFNKNPSCDVFQFFELKISLTIFILSERSEDKMKNACSL